MSSFKEQIEASNKRIAEAIAVLSEHNRGQWALAHLKTLLQGPAGGLDSQGAKALLTLVHEWYDGGRRDFISGLKEVVLPPKPIEGDDFEQGVQEGMRQSVQRKS